MERWILWSRASPDIILAASLTISRFNGCLKFIQQFFNIKLWSARLLVWQFCSQKQSTLLWNEQHLNKDPNSRLPDHITAPELEGRIRNTPTQVWIPCNACDKRRSELQPRNGNGNCRRPAMFWVLWNKEPCSVPYIYNKYSHHYRATIVFVRMYRISGWNRISGQDLGIGFNRISGSTGYPVHNDIRYYPVSGDVYEMPCTSYKKTLDNMLYKLLNTNKVFYY